jgi:hypothetical protein
MTFSGFYIKFLLLIFFKASILASICAVGLAASHKRFLRFTCEVTNDKNIYLKCLGIQLAFLIPSFSSIFLLYRTMLATAASQNTPEYVVIGYELTEITFLALVLAINVLAYLCLVSLLTCAFLKCGLKKSFKSQAVNFAVFTLISIGLLFFANSHFSVRTLHTNNNGNFDGRSDLVTVNFDAKNVNFQALPRYFFGESTNLNSVSLLNNTSLNNFDVNWVKIAWDKLGKVGGADFQGNKLWFVNQEDHELMSFLGLNDKNVTHNGGIKAVFSIGNRDFAYVAYIDGNCASAKIVSLEDTSLGYAFPCLPTEDINIVDLNAVGGGNVKLNDEVTLLSTGTPTMQGVLHSINQLAQNPNSPYGKILRLTVQDGKLNVSVISLGLRNSQGLSIIDGDLITVDHGPRGGDEINLVMQGSNFGWPLESFGSQYNLVKIKKSVQDKPGLKLPLFSFVPSVGVSDIGLCPGTYAKHYEPFKCLAVSSMRGGSMFLIVHDGLKTYFVEQILFNTRIRKFFTSGDTLIGLTDYDGVIIAKFDETKATAE